MFRIQAALTRLARDEKGTSALGYALIAALIAFILIGAVETLGAGLGKTFAGVGNSVGGTAAQQTAGASSGVACRPSATVQPTGLQPADAGCREEQHYFGITG